MVVVRRVKVTESVRMRVTMVVIVIMTVSMIRGTMRMRV
jgi:hypothetical protein